jgi:hypothetical protein
MFTIGVRYCGGCNPHIDRSRVVMELKEGIEKRGLGIDFTLERGKAVDVVLLVNGCPHACLEGESLTSVRGRPEVSVRGEMIDDQYVGEVDMVKILMQKIISIM